MGGWAIERMTAARQLPLLVPPIACMDAMRWLELLPPESVDLVITDPPYESLEKHRAKGTTTRLVNDWFPTISNDLYPRLMSLMYGALRSHSHCYIFCDQETAFHLHPAGIAAGFTFWKPLIWDKVAMGMGYHYRARYELIMFFEKGSRQLTDRTMPDVLRAKRVYHTHRLYPTEKPVPLMDMLVRQSARAGEVVMDPFMGSGASLLAAQRRGCQVWGCDLEQRAVDITKQRLADG